MGSGIIVGHIVDYKMSVKDRRWWLFIKHVLEKWQGKTRQDSNKNCSTSKNARHMKASTVCSSNAVAGNFVTMTELRNKISTFRDLLDFSPCAGSASVNELLVLTLYDLFKRYPKIKPDVSMSEIKAGSTRQALKFFCNALKSLGDLWTTEDWMVKCKYNPSMKLEQVDLERTHDVIFWLSGNANFGPSGGLERFGYQREDVLFSTSTPAAKSSSSWKTEPNRRKAPLLPYVPSCSKCCSGSKIRHPDEQREREEQQSHQVKPDDAEKGNQDDEVLGDMEMSNEVVKNNVLR
ncbi:UNVERIFIED_CONTAM: hypothetical protein Sradi_5994500 [Sesamum radiatum]|uniref:Uncharacterized protein n=1 Tax=Sesamum radiatum TaxID=300843 RepID=A0AAW2KH54_SESRA